METTTEIRILIQHRTESGFESGTLQGVTQEKKETKHRPFEQVASGINPKPCLLSSLGILLWTRRDLFPETGTSLPTALQLTVSRDFCLGF